VKVVYLNPSGQLGGAERSLLDIIASLQAAEPTFAARLIASSDGPLVKKARELGVQAAVAPFPAALARLGDGGAGGPAGRQVSRLHLLLRLAKAAGPIAAYGMRLRQTLIEMQPDVIHTNGFKMHLLGLWAAPCDVPVVWHVHDYVSARPMMKRLLRLFAGRCRAIITNSLSVAEDVRQVCGEAARIHPVYNAVDLTCFSPDGARLDLDGLANLPPAPAGTVRIGMFATMARWKGHEVFLRALAHLPPGMPVRAYVVGGGIYETDGSQYTVAELRRLAAELGVADRVGFTGYVDEPAEAMRACDIIVHASTQPEPFGLVIAEAMASARAVVLSKAGGAAELATPGTDALAFSPGHAEELSRCLSRLVGDEQARAELGRAGRKAAEGRFDRSRLGPQFLTIYRASRAALSGRLN
jgi:glycosyltransferase involved in cell wall biosynthesis